MRFRLLGFMYLLTLGLAGPAVAHEFWISPAQYDVSPGGRIVADVRVGQMFKGAAYPYIPDDFDRFDLALAGVVNPVAARMGDTPAFNMPAAAEGLAVIIAQTTPGLLVYDKPEMFPAFIAHKDLRGVMEAHKARGLPELGFKESFRRFAKSLIAVGVGSGRDRAVGLETEIIALANPYRDDITAGIPVQVLYQGQPRADVQVEVYAKAADGNVTVTTQRTDAKGRTTIPVSSGVEYLIDSVIMRPVSGGGGTENKPVWESLWASLTFKTPAWK